MVAPCAATDLRYQDSLHSVRHFILGTAGHIDHGKSTLVEALTGTDPDRLPEERARGMTIELGFAHLEFDDPSGAGTRYSLGIVDVPGHADFVRNMVAGVGSIHLALIIVAADDGWMPQTAEHVEILRYLGVERVIITVTKSDLLEDEDLLRLDLAERLAETPYADSPVVMTSALGDIGLDDLRATIAGLLREVPDPPDIGRPRLAVDRVFSPRGVGSVVTGTLTGGRLRAGQEVFVMPGGLRGHVRTLQNHNQILPEAMPGMRTALNLPDVPRATEHDPHGLKRGDTIVATTPGGEPRATDCIDVELWRLPAAEGAMAPGRLKRERGLRSGSMLHWHHGSGWQPARIHLAGGSVLPPGQRALAQLRFSQPVHACAGDRFILRDPSKQLTLAGGLVLEPLGHRRRFRRPAHQEMLRTRAEAPDDLPVWLRALLQRDLAVPAAGLLSQSPFSHDEITVLVQRRDLEWNRVGEWLVLTVWWQQQLDAAAAGVRSHHTAHPEQIGLSLAELRRLMEPGLPDKRLFEPILDVLEANGFVRGQGILRAAEHIPSLPPQLEQAAATVRSDLAVKPLEPPTLSVLAPDPKRQQALKFLVETGEVLVLDAKTHLLRSAYQQARDLIVNHLRQAGSATASDLRSVTGTTRRILMPLLERLDAEGVTVRKGDDRVLP